MVNVGVDNEESLYPPSFTPKNAQACPQGVPIIKTQQNQASTSALVNYLIGSDSNLWGNPTTPIVPSLNEMEKVKMELPKQLKDRYRWLEEKFKAMKNADDYHRIDARDLSLVLDLILPYKFKMPEFEKYNETSYPEAYITMFCRRMIGYVNNDQLLIHCFQESLNIEKKPNESFRQYAQRWREVAMQVQPPLLEKETTMLFINTLKASFINHILGSTTLSFSDMVMSGELIENAIRSGKIDVGERSPDINDKSKVITDSLLGLDMCLSGSQDFKDDKDCSLCPGGRTR
ncbi:uncharacterized protein LOC108451184 [Gossypium arboreum]|uniref:uncharacterized protein LOC108451184 n=1 Tax=Gossypium arboreum TaxID=29729 RepID=UPI0008196D43|nr:uncharacterized protein LOC108451184 [Gossypium arboreum]